MTSPLETKPPDPKNETMGKFSLALAAKTIALWREEALRLYPDQTNDVDRGAMAAAISTAGMLCVVDAISVVEPDDASLRLIALDEVMEGAMGLLISGATIAKIQEFEDARNTKTVDGA